MIEDTDVIFVDFDELFQSQAITEIDKHEGTILFIDFLAFGKIYAFIFVYIIDNEEQQFQSPHISDNFSEHIR